jgi:hypothetical protein
MASVPALFPASLHALRARERAEAKARAESEKPAEQPARTAEAVRPAPQKKR